MHSDSFPFLDEKRANKIGANLWSDSGMNVIRTPDSPVPAIGLVDPPEPLTTLLRRQPQTTIAPPPPQPQTTIAPPPPLPTTGLFSYSSNTKNPQPTLPSIVLPETSIITLETPLPVETSVAPPV